jgi:hypothetical protein
LAPKIEVIFPDPASFGLGFERFSIALKRNDMGEKFSANQMLYNYKTNYF